jgi:hypothetical protein
MRRARSLALAFVTLFGCSSGDDGGGGGGGSPRSGVSQCEAGELETADACRPAGWATCPAGFTAEEVGCRAVAPASACPEGKRPRLGSATCEPLPALACPSGFAQDGLGCKEIVPAARCTGATREALGQTACVPLGDCAVPVAGATHFVDPAATVDATHFKTIAAALAAAPAGAVIEVATGTYKESLTLTKSVTLAGRCAANVVLDGEDVPGRTAMLVGGPVDVELRGVTITRYEAPLRINAGGNVHVTDALFASNHGAAATVNESGSSLTLERSAVRGTVVATGTTNALGAGNGATLGVKDSSLVGNADKTIQVQGATLTVDKTLIADTALDAKGDFGSGIVVLQAATATVTATAIVNAKSEGLYSEGTLTMTGSVVRGTGADGHGELGRAVNLWRGRSTLADLTLDANRDAGLSLDRKASATAERLVVRDTGSLKEAGTVGAGILVVNGSTATVKRAIVLRSKESGLQATTAGSVLAVEESYVASGRGQPDGTTGDAAVATEGGTVTLDGTALVDAQESALTVTDPGSSITARDCVVADTRANGKGRGGFGGRVGKGASLTLERTAILRSHDLGLIGQDAGTKLALTDVELSHTTPAPAGPPHGRGLEIKGGASATVVRASFVDNQQGAVVASSGSVLSLTDVEVAHTKPNADGTAGRGVVVQTGASATIASTAVVDSSELGVNAAGDGTSLEMNDCSIRGTRAIGGEFGHGVVGAGATVTVLRTRIEGSEGAALAFADSRVAVTSSLITKNAVGVFVNDGGNLDQVPGAAPLPDEPGRIVISNDTRFLENATRVGGGLLPLPPVLD